MHVENCVGVIEGITDEKSLARLWIPQGIPAICFSWNYGRSFSLENYYSGNYTIILPSALFRNAASSRKAMQSEEVG